MKIQKKWGILVAILLLPSLIYLGLTTGKHHFDRLPVVDSLFLGSSDRDLSVFEDIKRCLAGRVSVVHFFGSVNDESRNVSLNGLKKLYEKYYRYRSFQMISFVLGNGTNIASELSSVSSSFSEDKWNFVPMTKDEMVLLYEQLGMSRVKLNKYYSSPYLFIVDKDVNIRARHPEIRPDKRFEYNGNDVSILKKMADDVQILMAEYELELRKNNKYKE